MHPLFAAYGDVKQVDFVVARRQFTGRCVCQAGRQYPARILAGQGHGTPYQPKPYFLAWAERKSWIGPAPGCSRILTLSWSVRPMMAKFSGSTTSSAPPLAAWDISFFRLGEVCLHVMGGGHLDCGYSMHGYRPAIEVSDNSIASGRAAPGASSILDDGSPSATSQSRSSAAHRVPSSPPG